MNKNKYPYGFTLPDFTPEIIRDIEQGTDQWFECKMGVLSASRIKTLFVFPKNGDKWGAGALTYLNQMADEFVTRERREVKAKPLAWGHYYETEARILYEEITGYKVEQVGFIQMFDLIGCSPDGLIGDDGVLEIKCPSKEEVFYKYANDVKLHRIPKVHIPQCFHNVVGSQREWCDFATYNPRLVGYSRIKIVRGYVDEMIPSFTTPDTFFNRIAEARDKLKELIEERLHSKKLAEEKLSAFDSNDF